jgi:hypothetical protein
MARLHYRFQPTENFWESFYDLTPRQKESVHCNLVYPKGRRVTIGVGSDSAVVTHFRSNTCNTMKQRLLAA